MKQTSNRECFSTNNSLLNRNIISQMKDRLINILHFSLSNTFMRISVLKYE